MKPQINLIILRTQNLDRLKNFYEKLLDTKFDEHTDHGPIHYGSKFGEVYLEIYPTKKNIAQLDGLGFKVSDLEATLKCVDRKNIHKEIENTDLGLTAIIKDPDNRLIYLTQIFN